MASSHQLSSCAGRPSSALASTSQRAFLPQVSRPRIAVSSRRPRLVSVSAVQEEKKPELAKVADSIGLPTDEGIFGFKPFPEVWVGRLAMAGFLTSCIQEFLTGKGTLQQVGLLTPNPFLLVVILAASGGASVFGFGRTIARARTQNMSPTELKRYGNFLGIANEAKEISNTETEMKQGWAGKQDSPPESLTGSASNTPTDTFQNEANQPAGDQSILPEDRPFQNPGMRYARDVEVSNGRAAMLGFLGVILVEAATGKGILSQIIWYAKLTNLLGPASGF